MGNSAILLQYGCELFLENVNLGEESANQDADITFQGDPNTVWGRDVRFGGANGYIDSNAVPQLFPDMKIENYQKILGDNKTWTSVGGIYISAAVSGETPNKKLSDVVLKITPAGVNAEYYIDEEVPRIPLGEINADAGSQTFKFWLYNDTGVTLNDVAATDDIYLLDISKHPLNHLLKESQHKVHLVFFSLL